MEKLKSFKNVNEVIHILLVDDDSELLNITKSLLEHSGYLVTTVKSSYEALNIIKAYMFDILITDYSMEQGMNGVELAIEASKFLKGTPIILYTRKVETLDMQQIFEAGIAEVVSKPCKISDLDVTIKRILGVTEDVSL